MTNNGKFLYAVIGPERLCSKGTQEMQAVHFTQSIITKISSALAPFKD